MESVIGKAIDLVCEYTVVPIARQLKYVFCYKSRVAEMKDAIRKLENEKEIVGREKTAAINNGQLIYHKANDWLEEATEAQDEVSSLMTYEESKAKMSCCIIRAQILNPIARHKLGRKATKKKMAIQVLRNDRPKHDHEISYAPNPPGIVDPANTTATATSAFYDGIFRSSQWEKIVEEIMTALKDHRTNVIGLHGMGGVGKSTMINEVYDQVKKQCMFDEVLRVEVKVKPEVGRIQGEIAFQLGLKFDNDLTAIRANLLKERLMKTEKKKSVLIILDDLWEKLDLQQVGIPLGGNDQVQIKLLLTSREEYLLSDKMGAREIIHLNILSDADSLKMFMFVVGVGAEGVNDDIASEIARKCSGLPIVIEATAKALKDRALDEWEKILKRLDNDDVLEKLKVSYDYLPSKESKELFLICGISRGSSIIVRDLLKYTFGLQLYDKKDSYTLGAATAKLEEFLSRLEAASILLKSDDNRYVKIHDRMRELAFKIVNENRPEWAHDITLNDNRCDLPHASEMKLLLSCCEGDAMELQESFLKDMKQLNVLEFTNVRIVLPLQSSTSQFDHLRSLRTLCLHNCCLDDISTIGVLKGLQILSFRGSDICKLPIQLQELIVLKMLDLSDCKKLTHIEPNVLGSLTKLEELNMENSFNNWEIDQEDDAPPSNARLIELKSMSRLSNIRILIPSTYMLPKDGQMFSSKLSMYQIVVGDNVYYSKFNDEYIKFSRVLMLTLSEYSSDIIWQDWVQTTLQTTEVLYLSGYVDGKRESFSEVCTKGFECLKLIRMMKCPFRYIISLNDGSSTNLELLFLEWMKSLESLCGGLPKHENAFRKLRVLEVILCRKLKHLFEFSLLKSRLSSQLENITVKNCAEIQCIVVGEVDNNYDVVTLSNSLKLKLEYLPKFSRFYSGQPSNVLFTGKKVAFPCLESLIIDEVDELEHIWHPTDPPAVLGKLRLLQVKRCKKLVCVINSNVLMRLQRDLESLSISGCGLMKEVFDVDDAVISSCTDEHMVLFSRLKELHLYEMKGLEDVYNNKNLMMMKGGRSMKIFPNIESLYVNYCPHLRYALGCWQAGVGGGGGVYENLKKVEIQRCDEMEAILVVMSGTMVVQETQPADANHRHHDPNYIDAISYSYSFLKEMSIYNCPQLRKYCQYFYPQQVSAADGLPFFSQNEIFPRLESIYFNRLGIFREIWPREVCSDQSSFNMLKAVTIDSCRELSVVFPSTLIPSLENLTDVSVQNCHQMIQIIMHVGCTKVEEEAVSMSTATMFTFPCLTTLKLSSLPKLDRFYSSSSSASASTCGFQFPSLETLVIEECKGVRTLYSHNSSTDMVGGALFRFCDRQLAMPNLKSIYLFRLENMTKIWKGEKPQGFFLKLESLTLEGWYYSCTNLQSLLSVGVLASLSCWDVLTKLNLEYCDEIEYLLTPLGATSLVHLTSLIIRNCKNIKEIVAVGKDKEAATGASKEENQGGGDEDDRIIGDMITFHHLKELRLDYLLRLEKFSSLDNLNFPSLQTLDIWDCPKMTAFSSGIATASAPKFLGELNSFLHNSLTGRRC